MTAAEQEALVDAVDGVLEPWRRPPRSTGDGMLQCHIRVVRDDAPEAIRKLDRIYVEILEAGLVRSPIGGDV